MADETFRLVLPPLKAIDNGDNTFSVASVIKLIDTNDIVYAIPTANGKPRVSSVPYLYDIAEGNITGHVSWVASGWNPNVGTTEEDLWSVGGVYVYPSAEMGMEVVSSDNTNDKAGGNGVLTVRINYLNVALQEKETTVTLNGTTAVPTSVTDIYRVNFFRAASVGSSGKAAGNINLRHLTDTPVYAQIEAGYTRARNIFYTVPAGKALYITSIAFSSALSTAVKAVRFTTRATYDNISELVLTAGLFFMSYHEVVLLNGSYTKELEIPTKFSAGVDLKVSAKSDSAGAVCGCYLRGWLEEV